MVQVYTISSVCKTTELSLPMYHSGIDCQMDQLLLAEMEREFPQEHPLYLIINVFKLETSSRQIDWELAQRFVCSWKIDIKGTANDWLTT